MCPKDWVGIEVIVRPLVKEQEEQAEQDFKAIRVPRGRGRSRR